MSTLLRLCLLLTTFATLVSSTTTPSLVVPPVYSNCSGNNPTPLPNDTASFKPQIPVNGSSTGWEEWVFLSHNILADGSMLVYSYKWAVGDPTSANTSQSAFSAWAYFPNGTFYHQVVRDAFKYEEHADGGFTYSIANSNLTWDPKDELWRTSVNAEGWIIESVTKNVVPGVPFAPNYKSVPGQISEGFFSRIDIPRGHSDGYMTFPWGLNMTVQSAGTLKHTWSNKIKTDVISAYVRGSTFLPNLPPSPIATVNWYQVWDPSGKEIDAMQFSVQPDNTTAEGQVFRVQITDAPETLSIVTTPKPVSLPLSYTSTDLTLPMCGPGVDFENTDKKMTWKTADVRNLYKLVDNAGGVTLYQQVNVTGVVWFNGAASNISVGLGVVEVYHR